VLLCRRPTVWEVGQRGLSLRHPSPVLTPRRSREGCGRTKGTRLRITRCLAGGFDGAPARQEAVGGAPDVDDAAFQRQQARENFLKAPIC